MYGAIQRVIQTVADKLPSKSLQHDVEIGRVDHSDRHQLQTHGHSCLDDKGQIAVAHA